MNRFQKLMFLFFSGLCVTLFGVIITNVSGNDIFVLYSIAGVGLFIPSGILAIKSRVKRNNEKAHSPKTERIVSSSGLLISIRILSLIAGIITLLALSNHSIRYRNLRMIGTLIFFLILTIIILSFILKSKKSAD